MFKIIETGSHGNAVVIEDFMIDCGVPFKKVEKYLNGRKAILLTHRHADHINVSTVKHIYEYYPNILIFGNQDVYDFLLENDIVINKLELNEEITLDFNDLSKVTIKPVFLYHDVENYGYLLKYEGFLKEEEIIFYGTDTHTLEGINIPKCDKIYLECNYEDKTLYNSREENNKTGKFDYSIRVEYTHLSLRQWLDFCMKFLKDDGVAYAMHQSLNNNPLDKLDYRMEELKILDKVYRS